MYQINIIEIVEPLNLESRNPWFRYIISNDHNTITGYRCGNKNEVLRFARECISSLNAKYPQGKAHIFKPAQTNLSYNN